MTDTPAPAVTRAFVLAAGLGKRMRPITVTTPKPLVEVAGKSLVDYALDRIAEAGIPEAVVNVHYLADLMEAHLVRRRGPPHIVDLGRARRLLETGGGVKKALPLLGEAPFMVLNSDSFWLEGPQPNLRRLVAAWDPERMDMLLLLASAATSLGYDGPGDFHMDKEGRLTRRPSARSRPSSMRAWRS